MRDFLGNELGIGQRVVFANARDRTFRIGVVEAFVEPGLVRLSPIAYRRILRLGPELIGIDDDRIVPFENV